MWQDLFIVQVSIAEKIIRTIAVYALIVVIFRIAGKRAIASMNTMDFVVMFLLSNVVQNAIIGPDNSFLGGAIGAVTLVAVNSLVDRLAYYSPRIRHLIEGHATDVIRKGETDKRALRRLGLRPAELDHAVRVQNGNEVSEIWKGTLEASGQLVVSLREKDRGATEGDIAELRATLARIEALLSAGQSGQPSAGQFQ